MYSQINVLIKKINWFKLFLYLSIAFLCYSLFKADYLKIPHIHSYNFLILSIILLFLGFIVMCNTWKVILKYDRIVNISLRDAIISDGLSIFAKYIPGKFMVILGRALFVSQNYNIPIKSISFASLKTELISLWIGLLLGLLVLIKINIDFNIILISVSFIILFSLILFSKKVKSFCLFFLKKLFKKEYDYLILSLPNLFRIAPSFILNWIVWCFAFYFFSASLLEDSNSLHFLSGFSFAFAATLAILAIITPGGLGVREGLLTLCLISFGLDKQNAVTIAIASRLWFLIGEIFLFILSLILKKYVQLKSY